MEFNETYHWYVNITDTVTGTTITSDIFTFRTMPNPSYCPCGPEEITELIEDTDTIKDDSWLVGIMIILFGSIYVFNRRR